MRVYELAKELGVSSKDLLARLKTLGIAAKSHMSALDEAAVAALKEAPAGTPKPEPASPPAKPAAKAAATPPEVKPEPPTPAKAPAAKPPPAAKAAAAAPPPAAKPPAEAPAAAAADAVIHVKGPIVVKDLAQQLGVRPNVLIAELMRMNVLASINERLDIAVARKIAEKHGRVLEHEKRVDHKPPPPKKADAPEDEPEDRPEELQPRAPVVTFLGHVDHGKTSLLDRIRDATVAAGEHGGITQHIGAYTVDVAGRPITFLDTPGHAAFTAMRARGANLTDIAVIIIAADDGIMPQTEEAIMHAKAAGVAIMVAVNKIDLPAANPTQVMQQLQGMGLAPEEWGGETICCPVSAQTGEGIDHLLEMILLQADMLELRANPARRARGFVIEARMEPGMGPVADLIITRGTIKLGDAVLCGRHWGRVRALINDHGAKVKSAGPSTPIRCLGLAGVPEAGAEFRVCATDRIARAQAAETVRGEQVSATVQRKTSLDSLFAQLESEEKLALRVIVKADTQGSVEAISHSLREIKSDKVTLSILLGATGNITGNDVMLASASDAIVLGFHVGREAGVDAMAKHEGVEIRLHHVIYELIDQVREAMTGLLAPVIEQRTTGQALIKQIFTLGKTGKVAGCMVTSGTIHKRDRVRVKRRNEVLFEGAVQSLRHFQDDVDEVRESQECGIALLKYADFDVGDILEFYELQEVEQAL